MGKDSTMKIYLGTDESYELYLYEDGTMGWYNSLNKKELGHLDPMVFMTYWRDKILIDKRLSEIIGILNDL